MPKVVHLTSVHVRHDTRILIKECISLKNSGFEVELVVADGLGDEVRDGIKIHDVGKAPGRIHRVLKTTQRVLEKGLSLNADLYHLHDPELIPIGVKLKKKNKKVIFDSHEDVPKQIMGKHYLNGLSKVILSKSVKFYEQLNCRLFDGIITATPTICKKFEKINKNSIDINNYPILGELSVENIEWSKKKNQICYVGGITQVRGIKELIEALGLCKSDVKLQLAGQFSSDGLKNEVEQKIGWQKTVYRGFLGREEVKEVFSDSIAGMVTLLPAPNHIDSQPNKMFEYMSAGLPVIASDFPLWREIVEGNKCGLLVDPNNPQSIADAIDYLIENPMAAEEMGRRGQDAVIEKYNWEFEEKKLVSFYNSILQS